MKLSAGLLLFTAISAVAQNCPATLTVNDPATNAWTGKLLDALAADQTCSSANTDSTFASTSACNIFVGRVLKTVYGVDDFVVQPPQDGKVYYTANEIATLLPTWSGWSELGTADNQEVLNMAKAQADQQNLVIAVWFNNNGPGHVALIGPGPLKPSGTWGGLNTPVSASFALNQPANAFLGQPLACAFNGGIKGDVHIWAKAP
jgi:hypothetical protein